MANLVLYRAEIDRLRRNVFAPSLEETIAEFFDALQIAIASSVYYWDRITIRTGGRVAASPRDIEDTGRLKESQVTKRIGLLSFHIAWLVAYAAAVYLGGVSRKDGSVTPGREWDKVARESYDIAMNFAQKCQRRLSRAKT